MTEKFDWSYRAHQGAFLSKSAAAELEKRVSANPEDMDARAALLGYYSNGGARTKVAQRKRIQHILWAFENAPGCGLGTTPCLSFSKLDFPREFERAKQLVLRQAAAHKRRPAVLMDLACAISGQETELAIQLLKEAYRKSRSKNRVAFWLAATLHAHGMRSRNLDVLREATGYMQLFVAAKRPDEQFDFRYRLAECAFDSEQFDLAQSICRQMLSDNSQNQQVVHVAHTLLGRMAFGGGDVQSAKEHLSLAGKVDGSPRLCSYGPKMKLAQKFLNAGEPGPVIEYLGDCNRFWEMGRERLASWISDIRAGLIPALQGDDY